MARYQCKKRSKTIHSLLSVYYGNKGEHIVICHENHASGSIHTKHFFEIFRNTMEKSTWWKLKSHQWHERLKIQDLKIDR